MDKFKTSRRGGKDEGISPGNFPCVNYYSYTRTHSLSYVTDVLIRAAFHVFLSDGFLPHIILSLLPNFLR